MAMRASNLTRSGITCWRGRQSRLRNEVVGPPIYFATFCGSGYDLPRMVGAGRGVIFLLCITAATLTSDANAAITGNAETFDGTTLDTDAWQVNTTNLNTGTLTIT